jgi:hypothetical protein
MNTISEYLHRTLDYRVRELGRRGGVSTVYIEILIWGCIYAAGVVDAGMYDNDTLRRRKQNGELEMEI